MSLILSDVGSFLGILIPIILVIVTIVAKSKKVAGEANTQNEQKPPQPPSKSFDEIMREIKAEKEKQQNDKVFPDESTHMEGEGSLEGSYSGKEAVAVTAAVNDIPHTHPAESAESRIEYVPIAGSLDAAPTEGCIEHYNQRMVSIDEEEKEFDIENLDLIKNLMIYGEVLSTPVSRKKADKKI